MDLYLCSACGDLATNTHECRNCGQPIPTANRIVPGQPIGLIGLPDTGKTCYLAALHDQLMHSAPEWRVEVDDQAFDRLTDDFWGMREGVIPSKTQKFVEARPGRSGFFRLTVRYRDQPFQLMMNDLAGEYTGQFCKEQSELDQQREEDLAEFGEEQKRTEDFYFEYLTHCRALLIAIPCWTIRQAMSGGKNAAYHGERDPVESSRDADRLLALLFRRLLKQTHHIRHVENLLVGVDVYGNDPVETCRRAEDEFGRLYRMFPGTLLNAGISVGATAVSNIGFGNDIDLCPVKGRTFKEQRIISIPTPFNVLEPIRYALEIQHRTTSNQPERQPPVPARPTALPPASDVVTRAESVKNKVAFLSYRRDNGAEAARLMRTALQPLGWTAFLDVEDLGASFFDDRLLLELKRADAVILILSPGSLDRCVEPTDWVRREIAHALKWHKTIVPVVKDGFRFSDSLQLPGDIAALSRCNCIEYSHQYFQATIERLVRFLSDPPSDDNTLKPGLSESNAPLQQNVESNASLCYGLQQPARADVAAASHMLGDHAGLSGKVPQTSSKPRWYYSLDGKAGRGPITSAELKELVRTGRLQRTSKVSRDGKTWHAASQLQGVEWPE